MWKKTIVWTFASVFLLMTAPSAFAVKPVELEQKSLLENINKNGKGILPFLNPEKDLYYKKEFSNNSWFVVGHMEAEGHKLNYLFHLMVLNMSNHEPVLNSVISITDETTGWYYGEDKMYPLSGVQVSQNGFSIIAPNGSMSGNLDAMHLEAKMPHGKINVDMKPIGFALYNGGTGYFPMLGMNVNEYSFPTLVTTGTLTLDDKTYAVKGTSWFDRQWQMNDSNIEGKWAWMDLNLDNGDVISLWGIFDKKGNENAWATILHPDGSQSVATVEPLSVGASDYWVSEKTGQKYPTHWIIKIPDYNATLEVIPTPRKQEIVSVVPYLHKYEGASSVSGIYRGKTTKGYGYVELVGAWK